MASFATCRGIGSNVSQTGQCGKGDKKNINTNIKPIYILNN